MYYSSVGILALLILLTINFNVFKKPVYAEAIRAHHSYRRFLFGVMSYYLTDIFWGIAYEHGLTLLTYIDTVFYFAAMVLSVFFWIHYIIAYIGGKNKFFTLLKYSGIVYLAIEFIILIANLFTPIIFWFDEEGVYHSGTSRSFFINIQLAIFLVTSIYTIIHTTQTKGIIKRRYRSIWISGFIMQVFIVFQTRYLFLPMYSIGLILTTCLMHTFVIEDEKETRHEQLERLLQVEEIQEKELGSARLMAYKDPLTGVKNKNAYIEDVAGIEKRIEDMILKDFGIIVFDVNGLKAINDTKGHEEGDNFIIEAAKIICQHFKHSPIYRIGGDEFVAFLLGEDYKNHADLLKNFNTRIEKNQAEGAVVIASGFADYRNGIDESFLRVFERADKIMYERKKELKGI